VATGDKARARGLAVYDSAQDRRMGYDNDNQRGDEIAAVMDKTEPTQWTNVTFVNGFANHPNTTVWGLTQYRIIGDQYLELRGEVACPSGYGTDATMFTVPAAGRPPRNLQVLCLDNASATPGIAMVGVRSDGQVTLSPPGKSFINLTVRVPLN
jgi:hypothetical protein